MQLDSLLIRGVHQVGNKGNRKGEEVVMENGKPVVLIFNDALHCPNVTSDLILMSKLDKLGYEIHFGNRCVKFYSLNSTHFLMGYGSDGLYKLNKKLLALTVKSWSLNRPVGLAIW